MSVKENPANDMDSDPFGKFPPYWSRSHVRNLEKLSQAKYSVKAEKDVFVDLKNGTRVCIDVYRPDASGKFPGLVADSPYSKDVQVIRMPQQPFNAPLFDHQIEAGDVDFFVKRGYVFVIMDAPGTGKSEGAYRGGYSKDEQEAVAQVIDWLGEQPWSNGNVGMMGISHFGTIQPLVAALRPKHLKAIFPVDFTISDYETYYFGGVLHTTGWYIEIDRAINNPVVVTKEELGDVKYKALVDELMETPDVKNNSYFRKIMVAPQSGKSYFADGVLHPLDGVPYWNERSPLTVLKDINIPTYLAGMWHIYPGYGQAHFRGFLSNDLNVPKKLLVYNDRDKFTLPFRDINWEILRWYDHWLKGIDTGIMDEPQIKILVNSEKYRYENEWPPKRTTYERFYLKTLGRMQTEPENYPELAPDVLVHTPPTISKDEMWLTYRTPEFQSPFEMTGFSLLKLYCSLDTDDANFVARTFDVGETGDKKLLQYGWLKASHRKVKEESDWLVLHDDTQSESVTPGSIEEYLIQLSSISRIIQPRHSIELQIGTQNIIKSDFYHKFGLLGPVPSGTQTVYKLYRDSERQSYLQFPVIHSTDPSQLIR